jgi:hypothetical protein
MRKRMRLSLLAVTTMAALVGFGHAQFATAATSSPTVPSLEGTWVTGETTCEQQNAALANAGFSSEDLERAGWDEATCGGLMHGSQITLEFTGDRLVVYQDGVVGWEGAFEVVDSDTFEAGDTGNLYITYQYSLDGELLTVDMVGNDFPGPPEELAGEMLAQTVIYESAPFAQQLAPALPYSLVPPEGWVEGADADSFVSPDGRFTLAIGTGHPEPGQTVEDRVRINREDEFADCITDPSRDRPGTVDGEPAILWSFQCDGEAGIAANTIHEGLGYRLTLRAPSDAAAELEPLMTQIIAGFTFSD